MDNKILNFIIGVLVGICITTAGFLVYMKLNSNNTELKMNNAPKMIEMDNFNRKDGDNFNKENEFFERNNENIENKELGGDIDSKKKQKIKEDIGDNPTSIN